MPSFHTKHKRRLNRGPRPIPRVKRVQKKEALPEYNFTVSLREPPEYNFMGVGDIRINHESIERMPCSYPTHLIGGR